jgi:hypothetical protein
MIRRLLGPLFLLLLVALPAARGHAEAASAADPFGGLDAIRLAVEVGGPLDPAGGTDRRLFAGELRRFNHFVVNLSDALAQKLEACGIFVDPTVSDQLSVEVFGRPEELQQCAPRYVFMIEAKVLNSKRSARRGEVEFVPLRPVLGLADEAGLERALIDAAVAAIAAELRNCRG